MRPQVSADPAGVSSAPGAGAPGEAVFTTAGKLRFKYIIHAAVMGQDLQTSAKLIRQSTIACLRMADELQLSSIAFPAFGTGVGGFPMTACAHQMTTAAAGYNLMSTTLERVQFCLFDSFGYKLFKDALAKR